jgi:ABC-type sulfate transport system permease component
VVDSSFLYAREAEDHAEESISTTLVTAIISIVSIILIGLILSPMLTKAETRRYKALNFFLRLPRGTISTLLSNIEHYTLNLRDEKKYL